VFVFLVERKGDMNVQKVHIKTSMTTFLDFTLMPDSQKVRKVRDAKYEEYHPSKDYWKLLRDKIREIHSTDNDFSKLDDLLGIVSKNRLNNYKAAIKSYKKFLKKHQDIIWFDPPNKNWIYNELAISVNPEIGLYINGIPHLIKLYFKEDTTSAEIILNKSRASNIAYLMWERLHDECPPDTKFSILNVKKGRLVTPDFDPYEQQLSLINSANSFIFIWNKV
jgi:hypothetical protein